MKSINKGVIMITLLFHFSVFAMVASITPGPTNLWALASGQRFGWRSTLPFVIGSSFGASLILFLTALGLSKWLLEYPSLRLTMAWTGTLWLSWLAVELFRTSMNSETSKSKDLCPGWLTGVGLQCVNPKTWLMAITVSSLFSATEETVFYHYALLASLFFIITIPCIAIWAWLGHGTTRWLRTHHQISMLNKTLAILLLGSVWLALLR